MAGATNSNYAIAPFTINGVTKLAAIDQIIFNDTNGPRSFIKDVQMSLYLVDGRTRISFSFNTDGHLGGGINRAVFPLQVLHQGSVIFTLDPLPFEGPCRNQGQCHWYGTQETSGDIFSNATDFCVPPFTVDIYPC